MKIKNTTHFKTKLLKLKLIKTKIYRKFLCFKHSKIENIKHRLKKVFQIIYKYHVNKRKILFLSVFSNQKVENVLKNTNHKFLVQKLWCYKKIQKLQKRYDLCVILDSSIDSSILKENQKAKIPVIILQNSLDLASKFLDYWVLGDFSFNKKKIRNNFFLNLVKVMFQKSIQINKKNLKKKVNSKKIAEKN